MRFALLALAFIISFPSMAQTYDKLTDAETGDIIFKGTVTFYDLEKEPAFTWFSQGAKAYHPDATAMKLLKSSLKDYSITILMGTWCEDTQNILPKLYTVLRQCNYPMGKLKMYGLDMSKKGKNKEEVTYHVSNVPTIILSLNGQEQGRIIESVEQSIEEDLADIIQGSDTQEEEE